MATAAPAAPPIRRTVLVLAACQGLMMTGTSLMLTTGSLVGENLAPRVSLATLPIALQFVATMATSIPASLLMARIGRRAGFALGAIAGTCGAGIATWAVLAGSFALFSLGVVLIGVFTGFATYYRFAAADVADDAYRSRAIALVLGGGILAAFAGPNLASLTRNLLGGVEFAGSYASLSLVYVLTLVLLAAVRLPRPTSEATRGPRRPWAVIASQPAFIVAVSVAALSYGVMALLMTATPLAMQTHDHSFGSTAFVIQWHVVGMFAPSFVSGRIIDRFGPPTVMLAGSLLAAACVGVNILGTTTTHFWIALLALGVGWNFMFVGATTLLTRTYLPAEKARVQAVNDFLVFTTVALATLSAGALHATFGWVVLNVVAAPLIGVVVATILWLRWQADRAIRSSVAA